MTCICPSIQADRLREQNLRVELEIGRLEDEEDKRAEQTARVQNIRYAKQLRRQHRLALKRQSQAVQDGLEHDLRCETGTIVNCAACMDAK